MTRETKIGLLVGLGFIVVFAVLLSNNGHGPSQLGKLASNANSATSDNKTAPPAATVVPAVVPEAERPAGNIPGIVGTPAAEPSLDGMAAKPVETGLPAPREFNSLELMDGDIASTEGGIGAVALTLPRDNLPPEVSPRVMPMVVDPVPTIRGNGPASTPPPVSGSEIELVNSGSENETGNPLTPAGSETHALAEAKPYTVKKGDTLIGITRAVYNNSSPKVVGLVADKNKIKDHHKLIEGQTILMPALPPDMFVTKVVSEDTRSGNLRAVGERINGIPSGGPRRAPVVADDDLDGSADNKSTSDKKDSADKPGSTSTRNPGTKPTAPTGRIELVPIVPPRRTEVAGPKAPAKIDAAATKTDRAATPKSDKPVKAKKSGTRAGARWYEVRPKDTFSSIAQRELGSRSRWLEIQQMNKDLDPAKIKPGAKIKLPGAGAERESMSADASTRRTSA